MNKQYFSLFLVLIFLQSLQEVLAAEYEESEKPIEELIEERIDPDEPELMEEPEEAVTKDTVEEEAEPEEEEEAIEEPVVPEEEVIKGEEKGKPKLTPVPGPEAKSEEDSKVDLLQVEIEEASFHYYKIIVNPLEKLPSWHNLYDQKVDPWVFLDEVFIY